MSNPMFDPETTRKGGSVVLRASILLLLLTVSCASIPGNAPGSSEMSCQAGGLGARECSLSLGEGNSCTVSCPAGAFACCGTSHHGYISCLCQEAELTPTAVDSG